jgi:hypothetical protein
MAHRAFGSALILGALFALPFRPLVALVLFGAALAVVLNRRGVFGTGMYRAILAFTSSLFLALAGVGTSLLGMVSIEPGGNFLLLPGLLVLVIALGLLAWAIATMVRIRRSGQ